MKADKTSTPLDGVKCVVNTCEYHMNGDYCSASKIEIHPRNANTTEETDCTTFIPEQQA